jgi:hypothetical protein
MGKRNIPEKLCLSDEEAKDKTNYQNWLFNNLKLKNMKVRFLFSRLALFILLTTAMVSCRKDDISITLNKTSLFLEFGDTITLIATVHPNQYSNKVIWESSDTDVATITSDGLVTAFSCGKATITATVQDSKQTAICFVTVTDYREKWVGDWDFVQINFLLDFGSASWDTAYYSGKISIVDDHPSMLKINNTTTTVWTDGVFFYGERYYGIFQGSNKVHIHSEGGSMNGSLRWTTDIDGIKKEEKK